MGPTHKCIWHTPIYKRAVSFLNPSEHVTPSTLELLWILNSAAGSPWPWTQAGTARPVLSWLFFPHLWGKRKYPGMVLPWATETWSQKHTPQPCCCLNYGSAWMVPEPPLESVIVSELLTSSLQEKMSSETKGKGWFRPSISWDICVPGREGILLWSKITVRCVSVQLRLRASFNVQLFFQSTRDIAKRDFANVWEWGN